MSKTPYPPSLRTQRLKWAWVLAPAFFFFAESTSNALLLGLFVSVPGLLLRAAAAGSILKDQVLATGGVYAHLRHPLYLGSFLAGLGLAVASGRWWMAPAYGVAFGFLYGAVVRREEAHLEREFGESYVGYRELVPGWIPWPRRRVRGSGAEGFRFPVYLRNKEWEAALGVFSGFGLLWLKMVLVD